MATNSTEASQILGCFSSCLLKSGSEKIWSAEVTTSASTDNFWEDDVEMEIKKKISELKYKFHSGRHLLIKHLPRDVSEEEIRELLSDFPVQSVQLQSGTGSGSARAILEDPEMLEDWDCDRIFLLRGQRVPVSPTPTEKMLCVARLPLTYTEAQFTSLVRTYGEVKRSFLMISEKTGESKGYGFVEYVKKEAALQAKNILDRKQEENSILCCDWLDSTHVTVDSLHSKCLYVDQLPKDFRDMGEFRKVFSAVVNPPYCQIALKNGCPQDWGLVEYSTSGDAEVAQETLNGYDLHGQKIRISYCIPGVRAINLYLKLLNESTNRGKASGLFPNPPAPAVFQQLQNLAKQNPVFAQSLRSIICSQIQNFQNGSHGTSESGDKNSLCGKSKSVGKNNVPLLPSPTVIPAEGEAASQSTYPNSARDDSTFNGVVRLPHSSSHLSAQEQAVLWNGLLYKLEATQNLAKNINTSSDASKNNLFEYRVGNSKTPMNGDKLSFLQPITSPADKLPPHVLIQNKQLFPEALSCNFQQKINSVLSNPQNLNQLIWPLSTTPHSDSRSALTPCRPLLSGTPSISFLGQTLPAMQTTLPLECTWPGICVGTSPGATSQAAVATVHNERPLLTSPLPNSQSVVNSVTGECPILGSTVPAFVSSSPEQIGFVEVKPCQVEQTAYQNDWPSSSGSVPFLSSPPLMPHNDSQIENFPGSNFSHLWSSSLSPIFVSSPHSLIDTTTGQKRKYGQLLPSPVPSREGPYVAQHSQGLGNRYADSYFKRKKKN